MKKRFSAYWLCQLGGWGSYILMWTFFYYVIRNKPKEHFFDITFTDALIGICITHLMRLIIKRDNRTTTFTPGRIIFIIILVITFSLAFSTFLTFIVEAMQWDMENGWKNSFINRILRSSYTHFPFVTIWCLIYYTYHYVEKTREEQIQKIRLKGLVKELQLKTIKSHINPHFIFNALNSIRALVDEDPERARTAVTELSNILRSSMYAEKAETTSLEKELSIVQDYLALETIRFEDRLNIEYDIDENTLDQPVPPMMLQILVENGIKHGISKQVNGGRIYIKSSFKSDHYELAVQNTGYLQNTNNPDGFGIISTQNRLYLLYGKEACFEIKNIEGGMVEAKVLIPLNYT